MSNIEDIPLQNIKDQDNNAGQSRVPAPDNNVTGIHHSFTNHHLPETEPHRPDFSLNKEKILKSISQQNQDDRIHNSEQTIIPVMISQSEGNCKVEFVYPLHYSIGKLIVGIFLSIITAGIFWFICMRNNNLYKYFFFTLCPVKQATSFLVENSDGTFQRQAKFTKQGLQGEQIIGFKNRYMDYYYNPSTNKFKGREYPVTEILTEDLIKRQGLSQEQINQRINLFEKCTIDFKIMNIFQFIWQQCTKVSMLLVYVSIIVWAIEKYYVFAINMFWITGLTLIILFIFYRHSNRKIKQKTTSVVPVNRFTDAQTYQKIQSDNLVPEDIIEIVPDMELPCDIILLNGECFVNESNITGETEPVPKSKLEMSSKTFSYIDDQSSVIYEGTHILNVSEDARGLVIRTGFSTKKGQVIRDTLFKQFKTNDFIVSLMYFNLLITLIFLVFYFICFIWMNKDDKIPNTHVWLKLGEGIVSFLAATLIPAINISMIAAIVRLQRRKIQGVHPESVYESGGVDIICMDKTGTITQPKVNPKYVWNNQTQKQIEVDEIQKNKFEKTEELIQKLFATCIQAQPDQKNPEIILGNEIDVQLYQLSEYVFEKNTKSDILFEVSKGNSTLSVHRRFDFQSVNACMTVIVQDGSKAYVFVKGSPEKLRTLSKVKSLPADFNGQLQHYLNDGYRVLGMGYKEVTLSEVNYQERSQIEKNLDFLGFVVLENKLKPDSQEVFGRLLNANVPIKVISGDNMFTVAHTASQVNLFQSDKKIYYLSVNQKEDCLVVQTREQGIVDLFEQEFTQTQKQEILDLLAPILKTPDVQISITGRVIQFLQDLQYEADNEDLKSNLNKLLQRLILVTRVFGRCNPNLKQLIVTILQEQNHKVCMLGDGSNDCLAIQKSDVGISFSNADAALASSFCSLETSIDCVEKVIAEGRSSISIIYEISHYYLQTSLYRTIFHMIGIFYYQTPGDGQLVYVSYYGGYIITMIFYCFSSPMTTLSHFRINYLMTSLRSFIGILGRWTFPIISALVMMDQLRKQSFYNDNVILEKNDELNQEGQVNTALFYQYCIWCAFIPYMVFTSYPSKLGLHRNQILAFLVILTSVMSILAIVLDENTFKNLKLDDSLSNKFKMDILISFLIVGFISVFWEKFVVNIKFQMADVNIIPQLK